MLRLKWLVLAIAVIAGGRAEASHIFMTDFRIDGVALDSTSGVTDPLFNVTVGQDLTFSFGIFGGATTGTVDFFSDAGLSAPANYAYNYVGGGTQANPTIFTFTRSFITAGFFDGRLIGDTTQSNPDYLRPNGSAPPNTTENLPFRVQVTQAASAVPEPASLALMGLGGIGMIGGAIRKRRKTTAAA